MKFTAAQLADAKTRTDLVDIASANGINVKRVLRTLKYEIELSGLQSELVNLQQWIAKNRMRVAVIFEGRDAAGKGGSIKRFKEHLNPRSSRVVYRRQSGTRHCPNTSRPYALPE